MAAAAAAAGAAGATEPAAPGADGKHKCWATTGVREFSVPTSFVRARGGDARSAAAVFFFTVRCGYADDGWTGSRADGGGWCPCPGCADGARCAEFQRHGRTAVLLDGEHTAPAAAAAALAGEGEGRSWHIRLNKMPFLRLWRLHKFTFSRSLESAANVFLQLLIVLLFAGHGSAWRSWRYHDAMNVPGEVATKLVPCEISRQYRRLACAMATTPFCFLSTPLDSVQCANKAKKNV